MRKFICCVLCVMTLFCCTFPVISFANDSVPVWSDAVAVFNKLGNKLELKINSEAAILMEEETGTILYTKNEHEKLRPASVTKVMTLLLIMEALDTGVISLTDKVPCSKKASNMGGSQIWLDETEELTVNEMLKAICVVSANDCRVQFCNQIKCSCIKEFEVSDF